MLLILKIWVWFMNKNKLTLNLMKKIWEETSYLEGMGRKKVYANRLVSFLCRSPAGERAGYTSQKVITPDASSEPLIAYSGRRFFFGQKPKRSANECLRNFLILLYYQLIFGLTLVYLSRYYKI